MNRLARFYNNEIRLPNLVEQIDKSERNIQHHKDLWHILLPTYHKRLCSYVSSLIDKETSRLKQLTKKKQDLKEIKLMSQYQNAD